MPGSLGSHRTAILRALQWDVSLLPHREGNAGLWELRSHYKTTLLLYL